MKNFTPGQTGCWAPQVCLPTYSPHSSSPASRTQGHIEMLTVSVQQEGGSQDASPGSLRPCKHPELPSGWPRPRTEGASAFVLLREHQPRFRLPHPPPPTPKQAGWRWPQSPPVYICPSHSQFLPPPLYLACLFSSITPHGIFPDAYPQNLKK